MYFLHAINSDRQTRLLDVLGQIAMIRREKKDYKISAIDRTAYMDARKKHHKTTCTSLPDDDHLVLRNVSKTLQLNEKSVHFICSYYIGVGRVAQSV